MKDREVKRAAIVKYTAELEGVTPTSVRRVINGEQNNSSVYDTYTCVEEEIGKAIEHVKLKRTIEKLIPIHFPPKKVTDPDAMPPEELISGPLELVKRTEMPRKCTKNSAQRGSL
jgi:hypothetical protein